MTVRRYVQAQSVLSLNWSTHKVYQECANCLLIPSMKKLKKDLTNKYKKRDKRNMQEKETKKINSIQKKIIEHALKKIVKMIKWYTIKRTEIKLHKKKGATKKEMPTRKDSIHSHQPWCRLFVRQIWKHPWYLEWLPYQRNQVSLSK